ncbi:MAG: phosphate/phosphite/phosphonate ABC transporter substrate-binding protein [Gammaproteobacteria bacterium]|nr:phosphate/phosphite/phosphonate ABC transporter substrate-binding protein [Gammaproteobacteria bacterium]MDH5777598.1 phosphate/phosphite/phosphonate ABC transporter substrate-binding protein [Gammaproteobacteria bacterium]
MYVSSVLQKSLFYSFVFLPLVTFYLATPKIAFADIGLSFGLYTSDKPTTLVKKFRPILNELEKDLSHRMNTKVSIKLSIARSYEQGINALAEGKVDFSRFGPASYILAREKNPDISLLAMEVKNGHKHFKGAICVHKDSKTNKISELKNKRFAFGDERSTIGRYLSQQYLYERGIKSKDLTLYDYLGRHDKVGYAVAQGKFDAGALKESTLKKLIKKGLPLRAIARFDNVSKPWVARKGLEPEVRAALKKALLGLNDKDVLKAIKKDGFAETNYQDYERVSQAIKLNKKFFSE